MRAVCVAAWRRRLGETAAALADLTRALERGPTSAEDARFAFRARGAAHLAAGEAAAAGPGASARGGPGQS